MNLRNPLANARGLGSAKDGVDHWWSQRVTAVALVPLTLWFVFSVASLSGAGYFAFLDWVARPWVAVALVIYFTIMFYHSQLGLGEVCDDYLHHPGLKMLVMLAIKFAHVLLGAAAVFAVLRIALGGA